MLLFYFYGCVRSQLQRMGSSLHHVGSPDATQRFQSRLSTCSTACRISFPRPGMERTFPALQGRFLTTGPLGKSQEQKFKRHFLCLYIFTLFCIEVTLIYEIPWWLSGKESACNTGDSGLIPGSGRSPGERHGNPLQYSCLENPMDRAAWQATDHGVAKSRT